MEFTKTMLRETEKTWGGYLSISIGTIGTLFNVLTIIVVHEKRSRQQTKQPIIAYISLPTDLSIHQINNRSPKYVSNKKTINQSTKYKYTKRY